MCIRTVVASLVLVCLFHTVTVAQPGGRFGGRGGPPGRGFDPSEMLRRMDTNNNGMLEQNEVSDRARGFISRMAEGSGIDMNRPISIERLGKAFEERRREREREYQRDRDRRREADRKKEQEDNLEVKGFELDEEYPPVPGFDIPFDSPLLAAGPLEDRYDEKIIERTERAFRYYDRNRDGILDKEEISRGRWSDDPYAHDLNKDGKLSKVEMCERYAKRYGNDKAKSSSSRSSSSSSRSSYRSYRSSSSASSRSTSGSDSDRNSRIARYAESIMRRYDQNRNGYLDRDEWKNMRNDPEKSDRNRDGKISRSELEERLASYGSYSSSSRSSSSSSSKSKRTSRRSSDSDYRVTTTDERLERLGVSGSSQFVRSDKNRDGQLQMAEFTYSWSADKIDEFYDYDLNGDGVITPQEWVTVEKEK